MNPYLQWGVSRQNYAYIGHDRMMAQCSRKRVMEDGTSSNCSNDHPNHCPCPRMRVMGGGSGSYGGGSYPGQRPCPRKRVMGGSSSFGPTPLPAKAGDGGGSSSSLYISMGLKGGTMSLRSTPQESILENATKVQPCHFRKARAVKSVHSVPKMWADKRDHAGNDLCDWRLCQFAGRSLRTICPP